VVILRSNVDAIHTFASLLLLYVPQAFPFSLTGAFAGYMQSYPKTVGVVL